MTVQNLQLPPPSQFEGIWRTDIPARELYSQGAGIARCIPQAVAVPANSDDLIKILSSAHETGVSIIPRGSGSGMAAGAVGPGIMLDISRFNWIGPVDAEDQSVRVGPGAIRGQIDRTARHLGLRFPVDPSSGEFCTIGGMAATNAAGTRTLRYGATRKWIKGVECVFPNGERTWIKRGEAAPTHIPAVRALLEQLDNIVLSTPLQDLIHSGVKKESSGYAVFEAIQCLNHGPQSTGDAIIELLVGSEGSLAVFTELELKLTPMAGATSTVLSCFNSLEAAAVAAIGARESGASACELLDRTFLKVAAREGTPGVPAGSEAVLISEVEGESPGAARDAAILLGRAFTKAGAQEVTIASHPSAERNLWTLRHAASPILARLAPERISMQFIEDGCVPPDKLPEYVLGVRKALEKHNTTGVIFGHAGDAHVHVNPLVDVTRNGWKEMVKDLLLETVELTASLGGTLAGEHGDGRLRTPLLQKIWSPAALKAFDQIKTAADPMNLLNKGVKTGPLFSKPFEHLRHDPEALPLSEAAKNALARIEHNKTWSDFKLASSSHTLP